MSENTQKPVDELTFREGMAELDSIVSVLESNTLELEESVERYERGVALVMSLRKRLDDAQQRIDVRMGAMEQAANDEIRDTTLS